MMAPRAWSWTRWGSGPLAVRIGERPSWTPGQTFGEPFREAFGEPFREAFGEPFREAFGEPFGKRTEMSGAGLVGGIEHEAGDTPSMPAGSTATARAGLDDGAEVGSWRAESWGGRSMMAPR
jgi:hypothetical protein